MRSDKDGLIAQVVERSLDKGKVSGSNLLESRAM